MESPGPHAEPEAGAPAWQPILGGLAALIVILLAIMAAAFLSREEQLLAAVPSPTATRFVVTLAPSAAPSDTPQPSPTSPPASQTPEPAPTDSVPPTPTLAPTAEPTRAPTRRPAATARPCFKQTSWPIYLVQHGDTLHNIAVRAATSWQTLTKANCLSNPNSIWVGMALYVPRLPEPAPSETPIPGEPPTSTPQPLPPPPPDTPAPPPPPPTDTPDPPTPTNTPDPPTPTDTPDPPTPTDTPVAPPPPQKPDPPPPAAGVPAPAVTLTSEATSQPPPVVHLLPAFGRRHAPGQATVATGERSLVIRALLRFGA